MATCPDCKVRNTTMTVEATGGLVALPVGAFSLAGAQAKVVVVDEYRLCCDPDLGGCGWWVTGYIEDGDLVARRSCTT